MIKYVHILIFYFFKIQGEDVYILTDWSTYHTWEDGRSNYAWDLASLNTNMMTYTGYGTRCYEAELTNQCQCKI